MNNAKILVVDDDKDIARMTAMLLETSGFNCDVAFSGQQAIEMIAQQPPDLLLADIQMPGINGIELCRIIKPDYQGGVIMLTAQVDDITELAAFKVGVDDFIKKPMQPHLLLARVEALLARIKPCDNNPNIQLGGLLLNPQRREATIDQEQLELTDAEFDILTVLAQHCGQVVSRDTLCESLKGFSYDGLARFIDVRISSLRRKLATFTNNNSIRTVRGIGYMLRTA